MMHGQIQIKVITHIHLATSLRILGAHTPLYHAPLWLIQESFLPSRFWFEKRVGAVTELACTCPVPFRI